MARSQRHGINAALLETIAQPSDPRQSEYGILRWGVGIRLTRFLLEATQELIRARATIAPRSDHSI
jgi:hypothetical protein